MVIKACAGVCRAGGADVRGSVMLRINGRQKVEALVTARAGECKAGGADARGSVTLHDVC